MGQGKIAQGVAKLDQAGQKLAQAQAESDVVHGKLLALCVLPED
jgi:hypothetical protein